MSHYARVGQLQEAAKSIGRALEALGDQPSVYEVDAEVRIAKARIANYEQVTAQQRAGQDE